MSSLTSATGDPCKQADQARPIGGHMRRPEDVADAAEYVAGDLSGWVSGQALLVSGGALQ